MDLAKGWVQGSFEEDGLLLSDDSGANQYRYFTSSDAGPDYSMRLELTYEDKTPPPQPGSFKADTNERNFSNGTGKVPVSWQSVTDFSGIREYDLAYIKDNVWSNAIPLPNTSTSHDFTGLEDNSTYKFAIHAVDNAGNLSGWECTSEFKAPDTTGPTAPTVFSITPSDWTKSLSPKITWSGITDKGNNLDHVQFRFDNGPWTSIGKEKGVASGVNCTIDTTLLKQADGIQPFILADGDHTLDLRGVDSKGNEGQKATVHYRKDLTPPTIYINTPPKDSAVTNLVPITH